ncbi:hypothetical protein [Glutamicibacter nicotianae]|uniref:Adhesin domain-containing protein n=1 Tax=Glutamicibacter nicotianae TaxID=37929 RepID=A0ABQ0RLQ3_GLUNI|nr:hypothetical protein [Glutamicibacter nicotianae]GEC12738.1 hypothetical protein ANI01nite_19410 [Glutamicibacter nicotianae]
MARVIDLTGENITRQRRKERNYGTKTDLPSTTVERGNTHWAEGSNVHIDGLLGVAGTATVSGTLSVTGTLNASGQINLSGSTAITGPLNVTGTTTIGGNTNITGELNVTGPTTLDGVLDIGGDTTITGKLDVTGPMATKGTLSVEGVTTIKNDLNVTAEGRITVGDLVIDQSSPGGNIGFDGAGITSGLLGFRFTATTKDAVVESTSASGKAQLTAGGSTVTARANAIDLDAPKVWVNGELEATGISRFPRIFIGSGFGTEISPTRLKIGSLPTTTTATANVHCDSNGYFYRIVT